MKKKALAMIAALGIPVLLSAETWTNAPLVDAMCAGKKEVAAAPDSHTRKCAIQCRASGYGIFTSDGRYLKLDEKGNQRAAAALQATKRTDHLRVDVEGEVHGDEISVRSIAVN